MTRLILGTAQLGLTTGTPYGINNTTGHLTDKQAFAVLDAAKANGFYGIDTAPAYGEAERRIKAWDGGLPVFTKWHVIPGKMHVSSFPGAKVLVHNGDDMGKVIPKGAVDGFSCYDIRNAPRWAEYVQVPANILDMHNRGRIPPKGRKVIVRSVFLQGLLAVDPYAGGLPMYFKNYLSWLDKLNDYGHSTGVSPLWLSIQYVMRAMKPWALCIGAETPLQVEDIAAWASSNVMNDDECKHISKMFYSAPSGLTDPRNWGQKYDFT